MPDAQANPDQAAHWNAAAGRTWVEMQPLLDRMMAPLAEAVVEAGFPGEGGAVLDIGCGAGATTLAMARRLGPGGRCLGVDISQPLVAAASARAESEGLAAGARFTVADAQTHPFEPAAFDAAISRFGVMFFEDPTAAFGNIRRAVRPGGRLAFVAWRSAAENPFMTAAARAAARWLPEAPPADPQAPGQFAFADAERVTGILEAAGWTAVEAAPLDAPAMIPEAELPVYAVRLGPVGQAYPSLDEGARAAVAGAVMAGLRPFVRDGAARFDMACWLVTAKA